MKKENATTLFFLTRSLFFGLGISLICKYTDKDTYIGAIIGTLLGLLIVLGYRWVINKKNGKSLQQIFANQKVVGMITRILFLLASIILLTYTLLTYKTFVSSFLLATTPVFIIFLPWIILLFYAAFQGLPMIPKLASALFPISLILSLFSIISVFGNFDFANFLPILTASPSNMLMCIISFAGISAFPGILTLHMQPNQTKHYIFFYLLSAISVIIALLCVNGVFGEILVNVFRFPEYMVLKQVKLFDFIEKIENILSVAWAFDLFITSAFSIYSIKTLIPQRKSGITSIIIVGLIAVIIDWFFDFNYVYELFVYYALPYVCLIFSVVILLLFGYLLKKKNRSKST